MIKMKKEFLMPLFASVALVFAGCQGTSYVDPDGTDTVVSLNQINIQDWTAAADSLVSDLLISGVLERAPQQPAVMAISRITNNTQVMVDTDSLIKKIRIQLNQTGKVVTTTTIGYRGQIEDELAHEVRQMQASANGEGPQVTLPYYTLSGKLLQDNAKSGNTKQAAYTFQLSLTTIKDGLAVWEGEKVIVKQKRKGSAASW